MQLKLPGKTLHWLQFSKEIPRNYHNIGFQDYLSIEINMNQDLKFSQSLSIIIFLER